MPECRGEPLGTSRQTQQARGGRELPTLSTEQRRLQVYFSVSRVQDLHAHATPVKQLAVLKLDSSLSSLTHVTRVPAMPAMVLEAHLELVLVNIITIVILLVLQLKGLSISTSLNLKTADRQAGQP